MEERRRQDASDLIGKIGKSNVFGENAGFRPAGTTFWYLATGIDVSSADDRV